MSEAPSDPPVVVRTDPRKARTRGSLVEAAQALLAQGRTAVSVQEITEVAGVGQGSFYNHFDSKEDLFEAAVSSTVSAYAELLDQLVGHIEDPAERFAASFRLTGRLQRVLPEQVRVLLNAGTRILDRDEGLTSMARHDLAAGRDAGRFDLEDVELGLMAVGGALLGLLQMLESRPALDDGQVSDRFTERVLRGLGVETEEAAAICALPLPHLPDLAG